ncbi:MAG TPA: sensor histidine kinase [Ktedonobacterales bacterium]
MENTARSSLEDVYAATRAELARFVFPHTPAERASLPRATAAVTLGIALATVCIGIVELRVHVPNSSLIYLFVVLWLATAYGRGPAIVASVLAILADDYFFVPPLHRLWVNDVAEWSALFMLLVVSVVTSQLTSLVREREREAVANHQAAEAARAELAQRNDQLAEQVRIHRELARMRQEVSDREQITRAVIAAGEEERRRISRELHDVTGQNLTALLLGLQALQPALAVDAQHADHIGRLQQIAQTIQSELHDLALQLRPTALDDLGLVTALEAHVEHWSSLTGIEVDVHCAGLAGPRLPSPIEVTLYRVIQEALTNVAKHARAQRVSVIVERRADHVSAIIEDDGRGFDAQRVISPVAGTAPARGLGLHSMQERVGQVGGTLTIESSPEEGTTIFVRIPLDDAEPVPTTSDPEQILQSPLSLVSENTEYADVE